MTLTPEQRNVILEALKVWKAFGVYGDGRDEHRATVQEVIDLVERAA